MEQSKFSKFSFWVLVIGISISAYILLNTLLHSKFGSTLVKYGNKYGVKYNPPPASQFLGPNAKD